MPRPTREEMLAELQRPSRADMIKELQGQKELSPMNSLYDVAEKSVLKGLEYLSPALEPIGAISKAGSELATKAFESTPYGQATRAGQRVLGSIIPKSIKEGRLSDIMPSAYSDTGEGIQLQKGGMLDPTATEAYKGAEQMALDPLNLVPVVGQGFGKAFKTLGKETGQVLKTVGKKTGAAITGVPSRVISNYRKYAPEIEQMKNAGGVTSEYITSMQANTAGAIKDAISKTGQELSDEIMNAAAWNKETGLKGFVDVSKVRKPFDEAADAAINNYIQNPTEINLTKVKQLESVRDKFFASPVDELTAKTTLSPAQAFELQQDIKDIMTFTPKTLEGKMSGMSQAERSITRAADKAYNELNKQFDALTEGSSTAIKKKYADLIKMRKTLEPVASDPTKTLGALKTLKRADKTVLRDEIKRIDAALGTNLTKNMDLMETYAYFGEPSWNPLSGGGTTSTTRTLTNMGIGSVLGGGINPATAILTAGAASPAMLKQLLNLGMTVEEAMKFMASKAQKIPHMTPLQQVAAYQGLGATGNAMADEGRQ